MYTCIYTWSIFYTTATLPKWLYQTCVLWKLWLHCLRRTLINERHWEPFLCVDNFLHGGVWFYVPYTSEYTQSPQLPCREGLVLFLSEWGNWGTDMWRTTAREKYPCDSGCWPALNPPCEARGCFGLRPHTGLDDLWVGHSWMASGWRSVNRCQSNREKTIEITTRIIALAFHFLDYSTVRWVFSTPRSECSPRFTSRLRKETRGGALEHWPYKFLGGCWYLSIWKLRLQECPGCMFERY